MDEKNDIPTSDFVTIENKAEIHQFANKLPFVQKLATGGYDGRGVQIIRTENEFENAFDAPSLLEDLVKIQKELAVIVARNEKGEISVFPAVEMVFHPTANLVEYLLCPAEIPQHIENEAERIAIEVVEKMEYVGLLAVEMFWDENDKVLVNELAPRPHNSGHQTIRACQTSQYEQHLRAILNLPLGSTEVLVPAAMLNLLGEDGFSGPVKYEGIEEILEIPGVYPHFYGKTITKPFRKMGHVTILEADKAKMHEKIKAVQTKLRVISE
jgi:5-(carboxyamino)imidazole ribonucleotide synthase